MLAQDHPTALEIGRRKLGPLIPIASTLTCTRQRPCDPNVGSDKPKTSSRPLVGQWIGTLHGPFEKAQDCIHIERWCRAVSRVVDCVGNYNEFLPIVRYRREYLSSLICWHDPIFRRASDCCSDYLVGHRTHRNSRWLPGDLRCFSKADRRTEGIRIQAVCSQSE